MPHRPLSAETDPNRLLLVVTGTTLLAEQQDRPTAGALRDRIRSWRARELDAEDLLVPVVVADLWDLNQPELLRQPAVVLGSPTSNAATAAFASTLPTALAVEGRLQICMDPELVDLRACLWGASPETNGDAVAAFEERYLSDFLRAAHDLSWGDELRTTDRPPDASP